MWTHRKACLVMVAACLGLINMGQIRAVGQRPLALLTPKEAMQLRLIEEEWQPPPRTRALSQRPSYRHRAPADQGCQGWTHYRDDLTDRHYYFLQGKSRTRSI